MSDLTPGCFVEFIDFDASIDILKPLGMEDDSGFFRFVPGYEPKHGSIGVFLELKSLSNGYKIAKIFVDNRLLWFDLHNIKVKETK
jgi:hypothetical protein